MNFIRFGLCAAVLSVLFCACDKGGGDDPAALTMTSTTLTLNDHNFVIEAPEGVTPEEYMGLALHLFVENTFKIRVTPGETRPLSQLREQAAAMNFDTIEFPVDEADALLIRSVAGDREEWQVYVMHDIGGTAVLCESIGPVGVDWTRAHADVMLASCRSLAAP